MSGDYKYYYSGDYVKNGSERKDDKNRIGKALNFASREA